MTAVRPEVARKRRAWPLLLAVLFLVIVAGALQQRLTSSPAEPPPAPAITLSWFGTASTVTITVTTSSGTTTYSGQPISGSMQLPGGPVVASGVGHRCR